MSTIQDKKPVWPGMTGDSLTSKYEKCRNITEEIYKRINITFQIKSLETASQSDVSDHYSDNVEIDSNELSNGTDLFAYEKSDTITSSEHEEPQDRLTNLNNNEIKKSVVPIYKPPRKRFRKKVKKRSQPHSKPHERDSSASSDEALPLSRVADTAVPKTAATVPKITILTSPHEDPKIKPPPDPPRQSGTPVSRTSTTPASRTSTTPAIRTSTTPASRTSTTPASRTSTTPAIRTNTTPASRTSSTPASRTSSTPASRTSSKSRLSATTDTALSVITPNVHEVKECTVVLRQAPGAAVVPPRGEGGGEGGEEGVRCSMCSMSFKAQRGLRRHVALSHILIPEAITRPKTRQQERGEKAA